MATPTGLLRTGSIIIIVLSVKTFADEGNYEESISEEYIWDDQPKGGKIGRISLIGRSEHQSKFNGGQANPAHFNLLFGG